MLLETIVLPIWKDSGVEVEVIKTTHQGHASEIGYSLNFDAYDGLCAVGGDGTLHEIVNGILYRPDKKVIPIGIIPGGTGNSFCEGIKNSDVAEAARRIIKGDICWMDVNKIVLGKEKEIYSINMIGLGVLGDLSPVAEEHRWLRSQRYSVCGLWLAMKKITLNITAKFDEEEAIKREILAAYFNHTQHFGTKMRAAPFAKLDDGLMEAVFVLGTGRGKIMKVFLGLGEGRHWNDSVMEKRKVKEVNIKLKEKGIINVDGEPYVFEEGKIQIICEQQVLPLLYPPDYE